jgi:muramoyltetrapeptide carboxypeptidase
MDRKHFLGSIIGSGLSLPSLSKGLEEDNDAEHVVPPALKPGETIAITSPAGFITKEEILPAIRQVEGWGYRVRLGNTIGRRDGSFGGSDEERQQDLQVLIDDPSVKAILCARGGYGITRIIDGLSFTRLREKPKWIIGFSDITALHLHLGSNYKMASLHSKMCNSFPDNWESAEPIVQETILSIRKALAGERMAYSAAPDDHNRYGKASGILVGGNLSMIQNVMGTRSEIVTEGRILFLEEVGEYLYSLDRMFVNLQRAGKLEKLAGLIIGGFNRIKADDPGEEFGRTLYDIIHEKTKDFKYPVCYGFPVGHQKNNYALKCGVRHQLIVDATGTSLTETGK